MKDGILKLKQNPNAGLIFYYNLVITILIKILERHFKPFHGAHEYSSLGAS